MDKFLEAAKSICEAGRFLHSHSLCPATSGNISVRVEEDKAAITSSGKHKGELNQEDILLIDFTGNVVQGSGKPSGETILHTSIYQLFPDAGAVLHTHSMNGTILSLLDPRQNRLTTRGYEIHKVFPCIDTHESSLHIPIFDNSQDYPRLASQIAAKLKKTQKVFGYLLRGHGLYVWGKDMQEARHRVEAFEFLFACEVKMNTLSV